ncbi:g8688 [Coccomyxa viridis]|uniref:G8688 protein n=1 Tax=Coccomyxa viridis TaxID=1274662 RepID=A0ABP1G7Q4_9CHLO
MDALLANYAGCKCSIAALLKHVTLPAERRDDPAPQLMLALLHSASLETLSALCRALVEAECSAHVAALFAKAIRSDHNHVKRLAELLIYMLREKHMPATVHLLTMMLAQRADGDVAMVLMHMLGLGVPEAGMLGAALVDAGAALLACNAEVALARCAWPQDATCRTLCGAALSIGRADVSARIMAMMLDQGHHAAVLDTLMGATPLESSKAVSQVLLRLADQQRYNVLANEITKIMEAAAVDGMTSDMARWIGILIRCGHARAWADIAGALHSRNRYWIVADIIEALVPCGSVAVDAQTIIWTHLGAAKCADYHISLVDRGKFEQACQLCAAAVLNGQALLVLEVVLAFIQDRDRADIVARKMVYLIEKDRADLAAQLSNALVNDRRFTESTKLAAALSSLCPVLPLLDCLREAGARVVPEVWHKLTASCMLSGSPQPVVKAHLLWG